MNEELQNQMLFDVRSPERTTFARLSEKGANRWEQKTNILGFIRLFGKVIPSKSDVP